MGSTKQSQAPAQPSGAETALRREEAESLKQARGIISEQQDQFDLLKPLLFDTFGISPQLDDDGQIVGFTDDATTQTDELQTALKDRLGRALGPDGLANPLVERSIRENRETTENTLRKRLGTGFDVSSAGIDTLTKLGESEAIIRDQANRQDIASLFPLVTQQEQLDLQQLGGLTGLVFGQSPTIGQLTQVAGGFGDASSRFASDRALLANIQSNNATRSAQTIGSIFDAAGSIGGVVAGAKFGK